MNPAELPPSGTASPPSRLLAYLRLSRLPNVFTALADVAMGFLFTHDHLAPVAPWLLLLIGSGCLYTAGMILNDVFDVEKDRRERPQRPLPSGQIDVGWARRLGLGLLLVGVACGGLASLLPLPAMVVAWRPVAVSCAIAAAVLAYDGGLKRTAMGPLGMGLCRFLNVLLGMSLGAMETGGPGTLYFTSAELLVAAGIGVYITGVTWFARTEAAQSSRAALAAATVTMAAGIGLLALLPGFLPPRTLLFAHDLWWPGLLAMLLLTILRGALMAVANPDPARVQWVVRHAIMSLILFDASIVLALRGAVPALCVLALIVPMKLLGRWVYST